MSRPHPDTVYIHDARTGVELCSARDPAAVRWVMRELGLPLKTETEWQRRCRRMALRLPHAEPEPLPTPPPVNEILSAMRDTLTHPAHETHGEHLMMMTVRETGARR
jgi:hypothetical protein